MSSASVLDGSFRDPSGHVYQYDNRIYRTVTAFGAADYLAVEKTGFLEGLARSNSLLSYEQVHDPDILAQFRDAEYVLEHPRLNYISYPYEWSFSLLKAAALLHLDIALQGLDAGVTLSDATAYNIQFQGIDPVFIDHLSFKPYTEREYWMGHRQFCEQFLNPLLLRAHLGVAHNAWFRGSLEGVSNQDLNKLLPLRKKLSLKMQAHVVMPARMQHKVDEQSVGKTKPMSALKGLPRTSYKGLLTQLRGWIAGLEPKGGSKSVWGTYAEDNTYDTDEARQKAAFIDKFTRAVAPDMVFDLGCNSGEFSETALNAGAKQVIGFDFDQTALDKAYHRAQDKSLNLLPLYLDAANPSPEQGWRQSERSGFMGRATPDAVLALAFEHHLAIGKNMPLPQVVDWLVAIAPHGIIEFVTKDDPTVQAMLSMRKDIFHDYTQEAFEAALAKHAEVIEACKVTKDGRTLYWYKRNRPQ
jgi:ribosomal protein L11 methylase PrmA